MPSEGISLSSEEELLRWRVEETMHGTGHVTQKLGFAFENIWLSEYNEKTTSPQSIWEWGKQNQAEARRRAEGIEELTAGLGRVGEWLRCKETCAWNY